MCRNSQAIASQGGKRQTGFICYLGGILLGWLFFFPGSAYAAPIKVSLLPGDTATKATVDAVKALHQEYPHLKKQVEFHIYPHIRPAAGKKNLAPLSESHLFFIMLMGRELVEGVRPELEKAIRTGGKAYCLYGGSYNDEYKKMGIRADEKMGDYFSAGGPENIKNMVLYALQKDFSVNVAFNPVVKIPDLGIYDCHSKKVFTDFEEYQRAYGSYQAGKPWIGVIFYKFHLGAGQTQALHAISRSLETAGFNVLPVFGPPEAAIERFFCRGGAPANDPDPGKAGNPGQGRTPSRVKSVIALGLKIGINPQILVPLLSKLNVPVIDAISLNSQSQAAWEKSPVGLDTFERSFQVGNPEMAGIIQPTVIASKERRLDKATGFEYIEEQPIPERIKRLTARVKAWVNLQDKPNKDKKIALVYYNYPPGKQNIGAAYLNVLPESLWEILLRLKAEGYDTGEPDSGGREKEISKEQLFQDIQNYGRNIGNWAPGEIANLVNSGEKTVSAGKPSLKNSSKGPVLIPLAIYKEWFEKLPESLKNSINKSWGPVEQSNIMIWQDAGGEKYLVIPAVRYGNLLFTPQPARGWEQDVQKLYHDVSIPPHHQYVAFFLWLKNGLQADAVAHIGTHGTHEWLSGKEVGFTREDPPEAMRVRGSWP